MAAQVTDTNFDSEVLKSDIPVMIDFWAEWCGPCKQLAPAVDELASELEGKVKVVKMNIDDNPNAPSNYGVRAIPTMMLFKGGELAATQVGVHPKSKLLDWINASI